MVAILAWSWTRGRGNIDGGEKEAVKANVERLSEASPEQRKCVDASRISGKWARKLLAESAGSDRSGKST